MAIGLSDIKNINLYSYKELRVATEDFSPANKIGEGGFGSVYKGTLKDGTVAALKVLSSDSRQGAREFLTEIKVISEVEHDNLVKLYGCCVEGNHRILAWGMFEKGELLRLVDALLNDDFNVEEACRFLKIGLLCTQDMPKLRPSMSTVVGMLLGEIHVNDKEITKPGLLSDLMHPKAKADRGQKYKAEMKNSTDMASSVLGKLYNSSSSSENISSIATMTFNSIYDRTN
ncbi:cold-responsive protein kinase 1 [Quercus suber]|uniref:Cold-responsive protein kinase 1 n=1 Tax=Quercus suber TaxID=58331 RepID=A0AAW0IU28_QUESU